MYSLYGYKENLRNLYVLSQPFAQSDIHFSDDLQSPYQAFLTKTFPHMPVNDSGDIFIRHNATEHALAAAFSGSTLDDLNQDSIIGQSYQQDLKTAKIRMAQAALTELLQRDAMFHTLFSLVIHSIFVTTSNRNQMGYSSHGGSASGAIGAIWLSMHKQIDFDDVMELFVHELTHHLLFLDELVHGHFNYKRIQQPDNFAYSSILNRSRPLDKVVHSMVVATEVVLARLSFLGTSSRVSVHPDTPLMLRNVIKSYESVHALNALDALMTARSLALIEHCHNTCQSLLQQLPEAPSTHPTTAEV